MTDTTQKAMWPIQIDSTTNATALALAVFDAFAAEIARREAKAAEHAAQEAAREARIPALTDARALLADEIAALVRWAEQAEEALAEAQEPEDDDN